MDYISKRKKKKTTGVTYNPKLRGFGAVYYFINFKINSL